MTAAAAEQATVRREGFQGKMDGDGISLSLVRDLDDKGRKQEDRGCGRRICQKLRSMSLLVCNIILCKLESINHVPFKDLF
jgi:hypothetical protein